MNFEKPTIQKPEEVATESEAREEHVETKEEMEKRVELLLDETRDVLDKIQTASRDEPLGFKNSRFGLARSNIKEVKELIRNIRESK